MLNNLSRAYVDSICNMAGKKGDALSKHCDVWMNEEMELWLQHGLL